MPSVQEVNDIARANRDRIILLEDLLVSILNNTIQLNWIDINKVDANSDNIDKTGLYCYGKKAGINEGNLIVGWKSLVANPTSDSDFETPYGLGQLNMEYIALIISIVAILLAWFKPRKEVIRHDSDSNAENRLNVIKSILKNYELKIKK